MVFTEILMVDCNGELHSVFMFCCSVCTRGQRLLGMCAATVVQRQMHGCLQTSAPVLMHLPALTWPTAGLFHKAGYSGAGL